VRAVKAAHEDQPTSFLTLKWRLLMAKFPQRLKTRRFAVSLTLTLLLGTLVGTVIGTSGEPPVSLTPQDGLPLVNSATSAIRVVGLQRTSIGKTPILNVSLQNISAKPINAYSVGSGKGWVTSSYYFSETAFAPNGIETHVIPLDSISFRAASREFTVTGVIFEDGSTDGQAIPAYRLREHWLGLRDYASRLLPCLHQLPSTLGAQDETGLVACETETGKWSVDGKSSDYKNGFQHAQRESSTRLSEFRSKIHSGDFSDAAKQRGKIVKILEAFHRR
jgi:hypothetical protein